MFAFLQAALGYVGGTAAVQGVGQLVGWLATKTYSVLGTWGLFAVQMIVISAGATAIFAYFSQFGNLLANYGAFGPIGSILNAIGIIKPSNFTACISIIISIKVFKVGITLYFLIWNKFISVGYNAVSGK